MLPFLLTRDILDHTECTENHPDQRYHGKRDKQPQRMRSHQKAHKAFKNIIVINYCPIMKCRAYYQCNDTYQGHRRKRQPSEKAPRISFM